MTKPIDAEIRHAVFIRTSPERVYDALTTAEGLDGWFTTGAAVNAQPGGEIRLRWVDWGPDRITAQDGGPVLEARRAERFVFQWRPDDTLYATTVEFDFKPSEGGTVVRLRERGYRDTPNGIKAMLNCATGWG